MSVYTVKNAVSPVAGRAPRFLPATKASPKEMLPIVDKPLIQYAADEALSAGALWQRAIGRGRARARRGDRDSLDGSGQSGGIHRLSRPQAASGRGTGPAGAHLRNSRRGIQFDRPQ